MKLQNIVGLLLVMLKAIGYDLLSTLRFSHTTKNCLCLIQNQLNYFDKTYKNERCETVHPKNYFVQILHPWLSGNMNLQY
jgi:hypothetical protein